MGKGSGAGRRLGRWARAAECEGERAAVPRGDCGGRARLHGCQFCGGRGAGRLRRRDGAGRGV